MKKAVASALVLALFFQQGCALMLRGTTETVTVSGKDLEVDGRPEEAGPVDLRRRQVHVISGVVNGKRETRTLESDLHVGWFVFDLAIFGVLLAPVGSIAFLVDLATGALNEFDATAVSFDAPGEKPLEHAEAAAAAKVCAKCGTPFAAHAKFCSECGARR